MSVIRVMILLSTLLATCGFATAAEQTKLTVQVTASDTGKPVNRATVIIRFKHGLGVNLKKIQTSWETKTSQEGKVTVPSIPHGQITIQVTAANYQTFGDVYELTEPNQTIAVKINPPQAQYSEDSKSDKIVKPRR